MGELTEPLSPRRLKRLLKEYARALREDPSSLVLRLKLACVLRELGRRDEAIDMYRNIAVAHAQEGRLVQAMAVCKGILEIDPDHHETQALLAELAQQQGRRQQIGTIRIQAMEGHWIAVPAPATDPDRGEEGGGEAEPAAESAPPAAPGPSSDPPAAEPNDWVALGRTPIYDDSLPSGAIRSQVVQEASGGTFGAVPLEDEDLIEVGADSEGEPDPFDEAERQILEALATPVPSQPGDTVVPVPLLSALPREAFVELLQNASMRRAAAGSLILREGEPGDAFYIIVGGQVRVLKHQWDGEPVEVARLGPGAFFGEFALLSDRVRHASVEAVDEVEFFEISRALLEELEGRYPEVGHTVRRFYRERLVETLIATAPFFAPLSLEERATVAGRLRMRRYPAGTVIMVEGGPRGGLYLILLGEVRVTRRRADDTQVMVARLAEGAFFGEMSLLRRGVPPSATVTAVRDCEIVELPPNDFYAVVARHPELWDHLKREAERREHRAAAILSGEAHQGESGVYLV